MPRPAQQLVACFILSGMLLAAETPGVWLDVPFVKQARNACGAASIAMIMQYWQRQQELPARADAAEIQRVLYSPDAKGIYARDMERYLTEQGFRTFAFRGQWADLQHHLERGRPLIVALASGGDLHYVVVAGLDGSRAALKNDPAKRKLLRQDRASFEKEWNQANNWTLLAVPLDAGGQASP